MTHVLATPTPKNMLPAYVLWFFLGWTGAHRYYLGSYATAVMQSILLLVMVYLLHGSLFFFWLMIGWWLVDAVLIPEMVGKINADYLRWLGQDSPLVGQATPYEINQLNDWNRIALASSEQGDQRGAIVMGIKALQQAERLYGRQHGYIGAIKSNLGEFYRLHGDLVQAHQMLVEAIAIKEIVNDPLDVVATLSHLELVYIATAQYDDAGQVLARMHMYLARCQDESPLYYQQLVNCYNHAGQLAVLQGDFAQAFAQFETATQFVGRLPVESVGLKLRTIINTGHALMGLGQPQRATEFYERCLTLYGSRGEQVTADISASLYRLGQALQQQGITVEAASPASNLIPAVRREQVAEKPPIDYEPPQLELLDVVVDQAATAPVERYVPIGSVVDTYAMGAQKLSLDK